MLDEWAWVFIYLFAFGISDLINSQLIKSTRYCIVYYIILLLIGIMLLYL